MNETLAFLSPDLATPDVAATGAAWRSPLARALEHAPAGIVDISLTGKLEVRGDIDSLVAGGGELVRISPSRALLLCDFTKVGQLRAKLEEDFLVVDVSAGYAGLQVRGETLLRRLTDLDLDDLPAVGSVGHVRTVVLRDDSETFRLFFPQEYGHYVADVVVDAATGLAQ